MEKVLEKLRKDAFLIFEAGLSAVSAKDAVKKALTLENEVLRVPDREYNLSSYARIYLLGGGKASADMAAALHEVLGDTIAGGVVSVPHGRGGKAGKVRLLEASHPEPDQSGVENTREILRVVGQAGRDDLVFCVISGGGSSLLIAPPDGISLADIVEMNKALLMCGADIKEINTIRKHVSTIKGGRLARKIYPASLVTLVVSDVVGDDLASIASGPTVPDTTSYGECLGILENYGLHGHMPDTVILHLQKGVDGIVEETVRDGDEAFKNTHSIVVASNSTAVKAASARAKEMGYGVVSLPSFVLGDNQDAAHSHVRLAKKVLAKSDPVAPPACIISGGETTVKVRGHGKGGRNQEFVLRAATEIEDLLITVLSVGTDGIDGPTDAAGAICDGKTMARARQLRLKATSCLDNNDSYNFFARLGDLMMTGPTGTNVSDIHIIIIGKPT